MVSGNLIKMSISDWSRFDNDEDPEFAYGKVDFLSNKPNSHKHIYTEEVIKEYANTVLGKWLIADYSKYKKDVQGHTNTQVICGYVCPNQEVQYRYDNDGYLIASVNVMISKLYATDIYEIFRRDNFRCVSIEEMVAFSDETKNLRDGIDEKVITAFNICGITILGKNIKPSVPNANMTLTQMAEIYTNAYDLYTNNNNTLWKGYDSMEDDKKLTENVETTEIVENSVEETEVSETENPNPQVEVQNSDEAETEVKNECSETETENADEEIENSVDEEETKDVENACDKQDEKMSELETKLSEAEAKIADYEAKIAQLSKYKSDVEESEKMSIINDVMSKVKDILDETQYSEYFESGKKCEYGNINGWKNEVLASVADKLIVKMSETKTDETTIEDYGIPQETKNNNSIYD